MIAILHVSGGKATDSHNEKSWDDRISDGEGTLFFFKYGHESASPDVSKQTQFPFCWHTHR